MNRLKRRVATLLAVLCGMLGLVVIAAPSASAHTGNLHAQVTCTNGVQHVVYTLTLSNVASNTTGSTKWNIGNTTFTGTPTSNNGLTRGPVNSTGNATLTLGSEDYPGTYTGAGNWVYAYTTFSNGVKLGSDGRQDVLPGNCGGVPTQFNVLPTRVDECNPPGVTSNIHWSSVPPSTVQYTVTGTLTSDLTVTLKPGYVWSDGTTAPKVFKLGADDGRVCSTPPPPPPPVPPVPPVPPTPKHAVTHVNVVDKCNCYRDSVTMTGGPNVKITVKHPNKTTWVFTVTGKVVDGVQYLLPSKIGGDSGWDVTQVYKVHTTNKVCPCQKHHNCHQLYPNYTPPSPPCKGNCG